MQLPGIHFEALKPHSTVWLFLGRSEQMFTDSKLRADQSTDSTKTLLGEPMSSQFNLQTTLQFSSLCYLSVAYITLGRRFVYLVSFRNFLSCVNYFTSWISEASLFPPVYTATVQRKLTQNTSLISPDFRILFWGV